MVRPFRLQFVKMYTNRCFITCSEVRRLLTHRRSTLLNDDPSRKGNLSLPALYITNLKVKCGAYRFRVVTWSRLGSYSPDLVTDSFRDFVQLLKPLFESRRLKYAAFLKYLWGTGNRLREMVWYIFICLISKFEQDLLGGS
jgi:hypothetical protein